MIYKETRGQNFKTDRINCSATCNVLDVFKMTPLNTISVLLCIARIELDPRRYGKKSLKTDLFPISKKNVQETRLNAYFGTVQKM